MYTLKEVTKMLNMTEHTIRYYTDKGLVPTIKRDKNNNRVFDDESINWLVAVKRLKECGMSIESIKHYVDLWIIGDSTVEERLKIITVQKEIALKQLEEAKKRVEFLEKKSNIYYNILNGEKSDDTNPDKWDKIKDCEF